VLEGKGDQAGQTEARRIPTVVCKFLMELGAFVSLEDISSELPSYREEVIGVDMDEPLAQSLHGSRRTDQKRRSKSIEAITR